MTRQEKKRFIASQFPQLELVTNREWADKAREIWVKVWEMSAWEKLEDPAANPITPSATLLQHCRAVLENCVQLAKIRQSIHGDKIDMDVLIVAAVLHDVSKLLEYEPRGGKEVVSKMGQLYQHAFYGAHLALEAGFPEEIVSIVLTHTHASHALPKTLEAVLFFYCDMADADMNRLRDGATLSIASSK